MKKGDQFQLSREQLIEEAFEQAVESREARLDPLQYKHAKMHELKQLKEQSYEREQAIKKATQENEAKQKRELEERLKETERKLEEASRRNAHA
jgi:gas vesicle protein